MNWWGVYLLVFVLLAGNVFGIGLSLNPADVNITDLRRGGYAEHDFTIGTTSEQPVSVNMILDTNNQITEWLTFEPDVTNFNISRSSPQRMTMIVQPPEDVPNGIYNGMLRFKINQNRRFEGQTGSVIEVGIGSKLSFEISDMEIVSCFVQSTSVDSAELGDDANVKLRIFNSGNVIISPPVEVQIWDKAQNNIIQTIFSEEKEIRPTVGEEILIEFNTKNILPDQYYAEVIVDECDYQDIFTFDVLTPGSVTVSGRLLQITNKVWNNVGDEITIEPTFINTGEKTVSAVFRGEIFLDDELVEDVESGFLEVEKDQTVKMPIVFEPDEPGRYVVKGRVYYDNKQTFEKTSVINVNPRNVKYDGTTKEINADNSALVYAYITIIILILILLIFIKKKKKR